MATSPFRNHLQKNKWLQKIGIAGVLFFLIKGIAWIAVAYLIIK